MFFDCLVLFCSHVTDTEQMCNLREEAHLQKDFKPAGSIENIFPGTYYLTEVDSMFRRKYEIKQ